MFEDFDSLDMYGFLDYLEESSNIIDNDDLEFSNEINKLEEQYGIFEGTDGNLYVEDFALQIVMEDYQMDQDDAFVTIMEAYEEDLENLLEASKRYKKQQNKFQGWKKAADNEVQEYENNKIEKYNNVFGDKQTAFSNYTAEEERGKKMDADHITNLSNQSAGHKKQQNKNFGGSALVGAGAVGVGLAATKLYKAHKAKQRKNRGLRGKIRRTIKRFREDYGIYEQGGQLFIENEILDYVMDEFDLYEEDALAIIKEAYEEELLAEYVNKTVQVRDKNITHSNNKGKGKGGSSRKNSQPNKSSGGFNKNMFTQRMKELANPGKNDEPGQDQPIQGKTDNSTPEAANTSPNADTGKGRKYHNEPLNKEKSPKNITPNVNVNTNNKNTPEEVKDIIKEREPENKSGFTYVPRKPELYFKDPNKDYATRKYTKTKTEMEQARKDIEEDTARRKAMIDRKYNKRISSVKQNTKELNDKTEALRTSNDEKQTRYGNELKQNDEKFNKRQKYVKAGGALAGGAAVGGAALAYSAYKKHKENKRKNRGIRGMIRRGVKRLREDYGIYEENGLLFIENEILDYVMDEYDLYEEDAINLIMESYEIEEEELYSEAEEIELYSEGLADYDPRKMGKNARNLALAGGTHVMAKMSGTDSQETRNDVRKAAKEFGKSAAVPTGIAAAGGAALAYRAMKKRKAKKLDLKKLRK